MKNSVTTLAIAVTFALPHATQAQVVTPPPVPTNIEVAAPDQAFLIGHGFGTQNYESQDSKVVVAPEASVESVSFMQNVDFATFALRAVKGGTPALRPAIPFDRFSQASRSNRSGTHVRSTKRIIAGAIAGGVGGFFGGGFFGAHIEGDRCNCDDPGVRGFLIGAPIGAVAGSILGAKYLF